MKCREIFLQMGAWATTKILFLRFIVTLFDQTADKLPEMKPVKHQQTNNPAGNKHFNAVLKPVSEVAGYLWDKGWAERNGGNISVRVNGPGDPVVELPAVKGKRVDLPSPLPVLSGEVFYTTGTGKRMRDVAKDPISNGCFLKIGPGGQFYTLMTDPSIPPTSELPSHLNIHRFLSEKGSSRGVVIHTHPTELIALSHHSSFLKPGVLSRLLWSMIPETRVFAPRGIGIVPYHLTGSRELANETVKALEKHDVVLWEKHGVLAVGDDLHACFDMIDILSKSAMIYIQARMAGFIPEGLSEDQMQELADAFRIL